MKRAIAECLNMFNLFGISKALNLLNSEATQLLNIYSNGI